MFHAFCFIRLFYIQGDGAMLVTGHYPILRGQVCHEIKCYPIILIPFLAFKGKLQPEERKDKPVFCNLNFLPPDKIFGTVKRGYYSIQFACNAICGWTIRRN